MHYYNGLFTERKQLSNKFHLRYHLYTIKKRIGKTLHIKNLSNLVFMFKIMLMIFESNGEG